MEKLARGARRGARKEEPVTEGLPEIVAKLGN